MSDTPTSRLGTSTWTDPPVDQRGHRHLHGPTTEFVVHTLDGDLLGANGLAGVFPCSTCDAFPAFTLADDDRTLVARTDCPLPEGLDSVVHLEVPSGRVVVADTLRPVFDVDLPLSPSYNSVAGRVLHAERMARLGVAQGYAGNTSPSLVRLGPGRLAFACFDPDAGPGEEGHLDVEEVLADVCTDVWSYEVADHDDYQARAAGHDAADLGRVRPVVVDVEPGTYRFRNVTGRADVDVHDGWPVVVAFVERVGPVGAT